jgi:hypothetical protein
VCQRPKTTFVSNSANPAHLGIAKVGSKFVGPLPPAQRNLKYNVVAVEYFSKWIEAKPLATITSATIKKFFWHNIVCRFGVPKVITVDNGTQFDAETFKAFCV